MNLITRENAEIKLRSIFKLEKFYDTQWNVIEKILTGSRILLIEKTGYGKSLCYQFPATQFSGTTVIFSPLISLMRDQVKKLNNLGILARCINSEQSRDENQEILKETLESKIKILYIAPERQDDNRWLEIARQVNLSMVVIDEAHCISVWGHDFRPAFKRIINLINLLPKDFPVLATTATATKRVEEDIISQMGKNTILTRGKLVRDNFHLVVVKVKSENEKFAWLGENLPKISGNGIIYTGTRSETEIYSKWLQYLNISAIAYNAGLESDSRRQIEDGLINNQWKCIVSTNALGMGIDKPDIRFIIHTQFPASPIHYYQEIGRAGRDGKPTYLILLFNKEDIDLPKVFIDKAKPSKKNFRNVMRLLKKDPMDEFELKEKANTNNTILSIILSDLIEQKIIKKVHYNGKNLLEYQYNAPKLNLKTHDKIIKLKYDDLDQMIEYVETKNCRMKFLCNFLGDSITSDCMKCDIDMHRKVEPNLDDEWKKKIQDFRDNNFPILEVKLSNTSLIYGLAASYYGASEVGSIIHKCKYENGGDFPDYLVQLTANAFIKKLSKEKYDLIVYIPPTESGNLVKNFAEKFSTIINIPVSHNLRKRKPTKPQKIFQNTFLKTRNVSEVFIFQDQKLIKGKSILLIDDIFDSGATIREVSILLINLGVERITPLVIAKTIGWKNDKIKSSIRNQYVSQPNPLNENHINVDLKEKFEKSKVMLFRELKEWKNQKARKKKIPGFLILSNSTLLRIADQQPTTELDLLNIKGVGKKTLQKYGSDILDIISKN